MASRNGGSTSAATCVRTSSGHSRPKPPPGCRKSRPLRLPPMPTTPGARPRRGSATCRWWRSEADAMKRLLLIGGGQAHAFVLRALAAAPRRDVETVLVTPSDRLVYSGMLPGWIAGHYTLPELTIPLPPLVEAAGAVLMPRRVVGLDLQRKAVRTERNELIEFDLISIATGPAVDFDAIPGSRDFALPVRPLDNFVEGWMRIHAHALTSEAPVRITVIGAGAGG